MRRIETDIPGVCLVEPDVFGDARGFFMETYHRERYAELGICDIFLQDSHAMSLAGTIRGLHYQLHRPQAKLCRVAVGRVLDVAVDIRRGSPSFGRCVVTELSSENRRQIYIPAGFAHGYLALSETVEFLYKSSDFYDPADQRGIAWNDPDLAIAWNVANPLLSEKDRSNPRLRDLSEAELPRYAP